MTVTSNIDIFTKRVSARLRKLQPSDPNFKQSLLRIALLISNKAKLNIRQKRIIDTGALWNSIIYEIKSKGNKNEVVVGSAGIPYAAMHEFGGVFTDKMRKAMFAALRRAGKLQTNRNKNIIRGSEFKARPYLRPALYESKEKIARILMTLIKET